MKTGFTLMELLVVVLIIGILAAIAVPQYKKATEKSRMVEAVSWINAAYKAEQLYQEANDVYTSHLDELDIEMPGVPWNPANGNNATVGKNFFFTIWSNPPKDKTLVITAQRGKANLPGFTPGTGQYDQYTISLSIDENGTVRRWCQSTKPTAPLTADITSGASEICRVLSNGHPGGMM